MSLNTLKKLTKEELSNTLLEYQNKLDHTLSNINTGFTKMEFSLWLKGELTIIY